MPVKGAIGLIIDVDTHTGWSYPCLYAIDQTFNLNIYLNDSAPKKENSVIIYSPSSSSTCMNVWTQRKIFWRKIVTRLFWAPLTAIVGKKILRKSKVPVHATDLGYNSWCILSKDGKKMFFFLKNIFFYYCSLIQSIGVRGMWVGK